MKDKEIIKTSLEKLRIGDGLTDIELNMLLEFFEELVPRLNIMGPVYHLAWKDAFMNQKACMDYKMSRESYLRFKNRGLDIKTNKIIKNKQFCVYWDEATYDKTGPIILNGDSFFSDENGFLDEHIKEISELEVGQTWSFDGCYATRITETTL